MTTDRQMARAYAAQEEVIVARRSIGELDLAERLEDCATARFARHSGSGWPRTCRSAGCAWCRLPMMRRWWSGICNWSAGSASSLAIIPVQSAAGLCDGVRRLRRGLRDLRDRTARCRTQWRDVCFAGMAGGDRKALVLISHDGVDRQDVLEALRRRWPDAVVKSVEQEAPMRAMMAEDAADLARRRRGVEPLRIVVLPQRDPGG